MIFDGLRAGIRPGIEAAGFEAEVETFGQIRFETCDCGSLHEQIFDPDLNAVGDADDFHAETEMGVEGAQRSRQHQVRVKRLADLVGGHSAQSQGENGVARQDGGERCLRIAQTGNGLLGNSGSEVLGDTHIGDEGRDGQPRQRRGNGSVVQTHLCKKAIAPLVDGLNAIVRLQASAQRGETAGHGVRGDVDVAPKGLLELLRSDDLAGVGEQELKGGQFPGRKMQQRLSTVKGAVGFKPEAGEEEG